MDEESVTLLVAEIDNAIQYGEGADVKETKVRLKKTLSYVKKPNIITISYFRSVSRKYTGGAGNQREVERGGVPKCSQFLAYLW